MLGGKPGDALAHLLGLVDLLQRHFGVVALVLQRARGVLVPAFLAPLAQRADGTVVGDRQQPRSDRRPALVVAGIAPDLEKNLICHLLGDGFPADDTQHEPVDAHLMASEQHPQGRLVVTCNPRDQLPIVDRVMHGATWI